MCQKINLFDVKQIQVNENVSVDYKINPFCIISIDLVQDSSEGG